MKDLLPTPGLMVKGWQACLRAWRGQGKPRCRETWDQEYRAGEWAYLNDLQESEHYAVIVGYIRHFFERPEILDVGCGEARLLALLSGHGFSRYTGVDISRQAIARANRLKLSGAWLIADDFETWIPPDSVDVIVFNESLYYARNPLEIVKRYLGALKPGGKVIVSMQDAWNRYIIWRKLDRLLRRVHGVRLRGDGGQQWIVRVFAARGS